MDKLIKQVSGSPLQEYEILWRSSLEANRSKKERYRNPSLSFYTSMVYGFANHLPFSMDIMQPEYVPGDFFNMEPSDVEDNDWFKWDDRRTYFNAMTHWGDSLKSGMILEICFIFQKMLLGQIPPSFELPDEQFTTLGFDKMTSNMDYNQAFFETLKRLPKYYLLVSNTNNNEERRKALEVIFNDMMTKLCARAGGMTTETMLDEEISLITEVPGRVPIHPCRDVEMMVHWEGTIFHDGIDEVTKDVKQKQLLAYYWSKGMFFPYFKLCGEELLDNGKARVRGLCNRIKGKTNNLKKRR